MAPVCLRAVAMRRWIGSRGSERGARRCAADSSSRRSGCAGRGGSRWAHGAAKRVAERVPVRDVPRARGEPVRGGLMVPQSASPSGDPVCCGRSTHDRPQQTTRFTATAAQIAHRAPARPALTRRALRRFEHPTRATGVTSVSGCARPAPLAAPSVMGGARGRGRVLTPPPCTGIHRRAFAASGAGRAQPLALRSAECERAQHHPVTLRVPPLRGEEGTARAQVFY
jgi:hypothetical protein